MRRLWLLAVVIVAAIAVSAAGAATTVVEEDVDVFFLPVCVDGVYGADAVSGTTHRVTVTTTVENAARSMGKVVLTEQGTLLGTLSPTEYAYKYTQTFMLTLPTDEGMLMQQGFLKAQLVPTSNVGPGDTTVLTLLAKFLINANGDTVLVIEEPFAVECK